MLSVGTLPVAEQNKKTARKTIKIDGELHRMLDVVSSLTGQEIGEIADELLQPIRQRYHEVIKEENDSLNKPKPKEKK
jgi:hypothetical protein